MPYVLVRGNLSAYTTTPIWKVSVSGLKTEDIDQLSSFKCQIVDPATLQYFKHPCVILTALEVLGYQVVSSTSGDHNEFVWTMRKEFAEPEPDEQFEDHQKTYNNQA